MFKLKELENTWIKLGTQNSNRNKGLSPTPRWGASLNYLDNKIYLIGGFTGNRDAKENVEGGFLAEIMEYDLSTLMWKQLCPKGIHLRARSNHSSVVLGEK
jgi:hypothetical protein